MRSLSSLCLALLFVLATFPVDDVIAQNDVNLVLLPESKLWVDGTSNQDDWTVHAGEVRGTITLQGDRLDRAEIVVPSRKIVSNRSTIMDRLMYTALKASEHPEISFALAEPAAFAGSENGFDTKGALTLAGETRDIQMSVTSERLENGTVRFTGSYALTMSDYGISPPTAMFGALRTGDDVVVHFDVIGAPSE